MSACCFVQVKDAFEVGLQHFFERPLDRHAAQMNHCIAACDECIDCRLVGKVARHDFFMHAFRRRHAGYIGQA